MDCFLDKQNFETSKDDIYNTLSECGCCVKCILRFIGVKNYLIYSTDESAQQHIEKLFSIKSKTENEESQPKKRRITSTTCVSCLGILSQLTGNLTIDHISDEIKKAGFDASTFLLSVTTPVCLQLRQFSVLLHLRDKHPAVYDSIKLESIPLIKEVWKWSIGYSLEKKLGMKFNSDSPLMAAVTFEYENEIKESENLDKLVVQNTKSTKGQKASRTTIGSILSTCNTSLITRPPTYSDTPCAIKSIVCTHSSVYLAGRYNKYSRLLSQTPWLIDGLKHTDTSVQELICKYIYPWMKPDDIIFSASGREDVDVRTLGRGRPFILQVVNPRHTRLTPEEFKQIRDKINNGSSDVAVRDFQVINKNDTARLKEGEETKKKTYVALCYSINIVTQADIDLLTQTKDLILKQKSPIRVLHRRSAAVREKTIHSMRAELVDEHHFRLYLLTQAGTYVKEFVHGDFGRTKPNVGTLLGKEVDILELDVESIELDWPPQLDL